MNKVANQRENRLFLKELNKSIKAESTFAKTRCHSVINRVIVPFLNADICTVTLGEAQNSEQAVTLKTPKLCY